MQGQLLKQQLTDDRVPNEYIATNYSLKPAFLNDIKILRAFVRLIGYIIKLWQVSKRCTVFHILANSGWSWHLYAMPAILIAKYRGCKVLINYRGGNAQKFIQRHKGIVLPVLKKADHIIVPSKFLQEVFKNFNLRAEIIPNIIAQSTFQVNGLLPVDKQWVFIATRNLEEIYGIDTLIKAVAIVKQQFTNFTFKIAGTGPMLKPLQALTEQLGLQKHVEFLGRLDKPNIQALYQSAHILLNGSRVDNMPNALLEALANQVAIVSSNVGGIPYMVSDQDTALLVPPDDPTSLAKAMIDLMQNPKLREMLVQNGTQVAKQYSWECIGPQWKQFYQGYSG